MRTFSWTDKKSGKSIEGKIYSSTGEAVKVLGEEASLLLINKSVKIDLQNVYRRGGQVGQRAKLTLLLSKLKANPELAKKLGIEF